MTPVPGERCQRFVGDHLQFKLQTPSSRPPDPGFRALLRTNLGRAEQLRHEIIQAHTRGLPLAGASWRDIPMTPVADGWVLDLPLTQVGYFQAKAYLVDPQGWQHWPEGPNVGISVHPDRYRTGNVIYCAFTRLFGAAKSLGDAEGGKLARTLAPFEQAGYAIIPPSGKLRDLHACLPHIFDTLGCRIVHLLPVHPSPTTYARFGRMGSPYAALDLCAIDPALVDFDRRTTGIDQFRELAYAVHARDGRLLLDIVINHTGWGSVLQENHPEWFLRQPNGQFVSPGAWGVTWEDLVELRHQNVSLWDELAEMFLTWCRRGVDGFRCDAGYKVPVAAWQYIIARVQQEYPETIFLLEGLGGAWSATESLLTEGAMQWAYSELFQNYSGREVADYLEHSFAKSSSVGLLVHYSETHDNPRLAERGRAWSLLRNRLCALASVSGGFGFTCGVEWLAAEKIRVHDITGLAWNSPENLIPELARLNQLLAEHPCFFDGARVQRLSPSDASVYALLRHSAEGKDQVLVLINTDADKARALTLEWTGWEPAAVPDLGSWHDLLGQAAPVVKHSGGSVIMNLPPGAAFCVSPTRKPQGLSGKAYRRMRAQAAFALTALGQVIAVEKLGALDWRNLAELVEQSPERFLTAVSDLATAPRSAELVTALKACPGSAYRPVVVWNSLDCRRITPVPPGHWLLLRDDAPFRASLELEPPAGRPPQNVESIPAGTYHVACFPPAQPAGVARLLVERYGLETAHLQAELCFLADEPVFPQHLPPPTAMVLLTNGRGGMARLCVDVGRVLSKYDCVLAANLHPSLPVDRHVFAKRIRIWVNADGFISPLDFRSLGRFQPGPPAVWHFVANAGDGRTVEFQMSAQMLDGRNTTVFHFTRPTAAQAAGKQLPAQADVRLTVRVDIEDRNFHWETHHNGGADFHFNSHTQSLADKIGFAFAPAAERQLRIFTDVGTYHPQPEWSQDIPHPVEQSRGQAASGDAFSPGWFDIPLRKGAAATLVVTAETQSADHGAATEAIIPFRPAVGEQARSGTSAADEALAGGALGGVGALRQKLLQAVRAFVVARGSGKTIIAGYPWFLDWGRDTFICARGLLAAGMSTEVAELVSTFARFEKDGTLPNTIFGEDASNRDTSDAPLWFSLVCEELGAQTQLPPHVWAAVESIVQNYIRGTPNGIKMDPDSGLIWSPSHFSWMDTNHPAATPREGYPVELQALWIRVLRQLARRQTEPKAAQSARVAGAAMSWTELAARALASFERLFWNEEDGYFADVLLAAAGQPAEQARRDDALRSNCLLAISLGLVSGTKAQRCVLAAQRHLVVPGALRSLAPLPVKIPLRIYGRDGRLLNAPEAPYWGHYEGDEDTQRKPAYHNGTAWSWTLPSFCEALARAWDFSPTALEAARAYLVSMAPLMTGGCLGHVPELLDGDAPHTPRGCDAQAWGATEALRVLTLLWS